MLKNWVMVKLKSSLALRLICHGCSFSFSFVNRYDLCHSTNTDGLLISEIEGHNILEHVHPLSDGQSSCYYKDLVEKIIPEDTRVVLIGEGTHGTQEFFTIRAEITKCLVEHHGYGAVFCEGDMHPFLKLNKYTTSRNVHLHSHYEVRELLLELFSRHFPDWMWSNLPMTDFVLWLKTFNDERNAKAPVELIGMDIQDPLDSIDFVVNRLDELGEHDLSAYAAERYAALGSFRPEVRKYGDAIYGNRQSSQELAVKQVLDALMERESKQKRETPSDEEAAAWFQLLQSARTVVASESYQRQRIFPGHVVTWNLRSKAFLDTILNYICTQEKYVYDDVEERKQKVVIWAHNSHVGYMSATGYASAGQINLGQLCRDHFGRNSVFVIGMTTHEGTVRAANADRRGGCWRGDGHVQTLNRVIDDSHEGVLHQIFSNLRRTQGNRMNTFGLSLREGNPEVQRVFSCSRFERFIGSCYLKDKEMVSHYTRCNLRNQFDYIFHVDNSSVLKV